MTFVKCLVWDLDNTVWEGVLAEGGGQRLRAGVREGLDVLDERGILCSIASRNEPAAAAERLRAHGIADRFLFPQLGWGAKSGSLAAIAERLRIGIDTLAFIDDDPFERDEVRAAHPVVRVYDAADVAALVGLPELSPAPSEEARMRRQLYRDEEQRDAAERAFQGAPEEFLATLGMRMCIRRAEPADFPRAAELSARTHQLNTTGRLYSVSELEALCASSDHDVWIAELEDRYGSYGRIGLAVVSHGDDAWTIELLLMSCRILNRNVGSVLLVALMRRAAACDVRLRAAFVANTHNRLMLITYALQGFVPLRRDGTTSILEHRSDALPELPPYVTVEGPS